MFEFSPYTPPQTPGTETKDISNADTVCSTTAPDKVSNGLPMLIDNDVDEPQEIISTSPSETTGIFVDISDDSLVNLKPKVVNSKSISYKVEKLTTNRYVFPKKKESNAIFNTDRQLTNVKNKTTTSIPTSLANKPAFAKREKLNSSLSSASAIIVKSKVVGLNGLKRNKTKACVYKKFDFDELIKAKRANVKEECKFGKIKKEETVQANECVKKELDTKEKACSPFNQVLNPFSAHMKNECKNVDLMSLDETSFANSNGNSSSQPDYDSLLTPASSKDSEMDADYLGDIFDGLTDEQGELPQSNADVDDTPDWLKALLVSSLS